MRPGLLTSLLLIALAWPTRSMAVSLEIEERPRHQAVERLPDLGLIESGGRVAFRLRGHLGETRTAWARRMIQAIAADIQTRFLTRPLDAPAAEVELVEVCLFETSAEYRRFVAGVFGAGRYQQDLGIYAPYHRLLAADLSRKRESLQHEIVHALLAHAGGFPLWLEEGLAELYAGSSLSANKLRFDREHRRGILRAARAQDRLPSPEELARADERALYGAGGLRHYALARFLLLYLHEQSPKELERFVREIREGRPIESSMNWKAFLAWLARV